MPIFWGISEMFLLNRWTISRFKRHLALFCEFRNALQQSETAVPAQKRIIVALGPDLLCFFKAVHGVLETNQQTVGQVSGPHLRLGAALVQDAQIVGALIRAGQLLKTFFGFLVVIRHGPREL